MYFSVCLKRLNMQANPHGNFDLSRSTPQDKAVQIEQCVEPVGDGGCWMMWLREDAIFKHLRHCSIFLYPPPPPRLSKCVLFHCCVSLHKNSTTSWVRQMFYCRARQLLKWLASIWVPVLQLAASAEAGRSISMRRIGLERERQRGMW